MSGPKCNQYVLSEQQRQAEMRRLIEEFNLRKEEEVRRKQEELRMQREEERRRRQEEKRRRRQEEELRRQQEEERQREMEEARRQEEERRREMEEARRQEEERQRRLEEERREEEAIQELRRQIDEECERLREELYREREQQFIAKSIDEVMEELGYNLIAESEPLKDAKIPVQAQVFSFAEGVGVQVLDVGGRVSMEVVGLGMNNRMPTDAEKEYLEGQMEDFCEVYEELEAKLEEKGVVKSAVIHRMPPDKKFARVLNMENLNKKTEVNTLQKVMKQRQATSGTNNTQTAKRKMEIKTHERRLS